MKLIVICSFGPMGSSLVAALLEKFGYLNIPVRKLGLSDYVCGKRDLSDSYMIERMKKNIFDHSKHISMGGVSVLDRKTNIMKRLDINIIENELIDLKYYNYTCIGDLYDMVKRLYSKSVVYKKIEAKNNYHIEMLTGRDYLIDSVTLYNNYKLHFPDVKFLLLHRPFVSWLNSLTSQAFSRSKKNKLKLFKRFKVGDYYNVFQKYENFINSIDGLSIQFDDLFIPNTDKIINKVSKYINQKPPDIKWENAIYDLYGGLKCYNEAFTQFDNKIDYLSKDLQSLIVKLIKKEDKINILDNIRTTLLYLRDGIKFH
jgi:hypothetical protein